MYSRPPPYTIAIIGAGIAGPVLALTILTHPTLKELYKPVIYERLPRPSPSSPDQNEANSNSGAAVALTSNALFPLYSLGLRDQLDSISCETERIKIWRAWGGESGVGSQHKYFNQINHPNWQEDLGTCLRVVERGDLQALVLRRVRELGGEIAYGKRIVGIERSEGAGEEIDGEMKLLFEDGEEIGADLVVGADGAWSHVRRWIIGDGGEERWKPEFAGADGIYGVSKAAESSHAVEGEVREDGEGVKPGDTHWVLLDSGTASTWALPGGRQFWTVSFPSQTPPVRESKDREPQRQARSKLYDADVTLGGYGLEATEEILKKYENTWLPNGGNFKELFRRSERIVRAPLWYRAWEGSEIGRGNVVLVGDAARLMLPSSGQGACFAIEDATLLANALLNNTPASTPDFSTAVAEYTQSRVPRSKSMTRQSYWTAQLGVSDRWWWRWLRDAATAWLPMGGDPKSNQAKKRKDPMGWLYEVRYGVELREEKQDSGN